MSSRREYRLMARPTNSSDVPPGWHGLSRKAILEQLDASLRRLVTDYIDVYYIHRFDYQVPVEETMQTLHDVVRGGEGALPGRLVAVGLAVRQAANRRRASRTRISPERCSASAT
jgi:aryl-alcohol dehydrogenase-like predicted oxidoreductase